jgi:hypothetical protein
MWTVLAAFQFGILCLLMCSLETETYKTNLTLET